MIKIESIWKDKTKYRNMLKVEDNKHYGILVSQDDWTKSNVRCSAKCNAK